MSKTIAIAGAGIGGLCAALALAKRGVKAHVYEQSAKLGEVGAGLQLSPNAMHVLNALGLANVIQDYAFRPQSAVMRHYQTGAQYFSVPLGDAALQKFGAGYLHIHRADLHQVLLQACEQENVSIHLGHAIQNYSQNDNGVAIQFENGQDFDADVLIGADGIKSTVQACMLGKTPARFTGQVAWRGTVVANKLPKNLVKPNANLWVGPGKHFVSYYLRGGDLINFVAVQERSDWLNESWNELGDVTELRDVFSGWHPEITELLAATEQCFLWALFDRAPLEKWADNKVALLGDACHPMLPFLAQGAAMAIEDSYVLADCLATESNTQLALQNYQAIRIKRTTGIQLDARKNANLYHMSSALERSKLKVLSALSHFGLSDKLAAGKLDEIYAYNIVHQLGA